MNIDSYRAGKSVGRILGAISSGCRSLAATWPKGAPDSDAKEVVELAKFHGLITRFDERGITIEEPEKKRPDLHVVPSPSSNGGE